MILYLRLAWRNIWRHKRRTLIVVLSIGLTLAMMMLYDGMITGFQDAIYGNAIKVLGGNLQIHASGYSDQKIENPIMPLADDQAVIAAVEAQPQVEVASRRIVTGGLASNRAGAFALKIIGIEPEKESVVSLIAQNVTAGRYLQPDDQDLAFIGKGLADAMEVGVGDRFTLVGGGLHEQLRRRTMTVVGIYDVNMADVEKQTIYISLAEAQDLYGLPGQSTEVMVTLKQIGGEKAVMDALKPALTGYEMSSWQTSFPELEAALTTKSGAMNVFGVIILLISGIGILNLLLMAVFERTREIGVLGALGMKPGQISILFLLEGAMMGLVGLAAGVGLGMLVNGWLGSVGMDYSQFSSMTSYMALISGRVYPSLGLEKLLQRGLTVVIIAILASLYPAREAARHEPATALHYV
jgi:ABC-type lipoprotein release transport system permease subunit